MNGTLTVYTICSVDAFHTRVINQSTTSFRTESASHHKTTGKIHTRYFLPNYPEAGDIHPFHPPCFIPWYLVHIYQVYTSTMVQLAAATARVGKHT